MTWVILYSGRMRVEMEYIIYNCNIKELRKQQSFCKNILLKRKNTNNAKSKCLFNIVTSSTKEFICYDIKQTFTENISRRYIILVAL